MATDGNNRCPSAARSMPVVKRRVCECWPYDALRVEVQTPKRHIPGVLSATLFPNSPSFAQNWVRRYESNQSNLPKTRLLRNQRDSLVPVIFFLSLVFDFKVRQLPTLVEERLRRGVEAEPDEPAFRRTRIHPIGL